MINTIRAWFIDLFTTTADPVVEPCSDYVEFPVSIYQTVEAAAVETADEDTDLWEQSLRNKYGINQAMENA